PGDVQRSAAGRHAESRPIDPEEILARRAEILPAPVRVFQYHQQRCHGRPQCGSDQFGLWNNYQPGQCGAEDSDWRKNSLVIRTRIPSPPRRLPMNEWLRVLLLPALYLLAGATAWSA